MSDHHVFVLRDPRDRNVFSVGLGRSRPPSSDDDPATYAHGVSLARVQSIQSDGHDVEIIVVANDLSSQIEARRVQVAVMLAYEAMSVSAETPMPVLASSRRAQGHPRTSAEADPFTHPEVQAYLVSTSQEMGRLSAELAKAQENMSGPKQSGVVDQRRQLEDLVLDQTAQISELNRALDRVRALRDMSGWAARSNGSSGLSDRIHLSDLDQALTGAPAADSFE